MLLVLVLTIAAAPVFCSPRIEVNNPSCEVTIQAAGATVSHTFTVTNKGDQTLQITDAQPSCVCTTVAPTKVELPPGKSVGFLVQVDTTGFTGVVARTVTLMSNDPAAPTLVLLVTVTNAAEAQSWLPTITVSDFQKRFYVLLDVRTPEEYASGHLLGAVNVPLSELQNNLAAWTPRLPRDVPIVVQCRSGVRSVQATQILLKAGFTNVLNLEGGILEWANAFGPQYLIGGETSAR